MAEQDNAVYIGLMTGTSMDSIDAVAASFPATGPKLLATVSHALGADLREALLAVDGHAPLGEIAELDVQVGEALADAVLALLRDTGLQRGDVRAIGSHGQTIMHRPGQPCPVTMQIGDPNVIVERTGITTVADFRRRDVAAGGEGAPLAPAFHRAFFASRDEVRVLVNIGGMANLTRLPADAGDALIGFDTGPGNVLMDAWTFQQRGEAYDDNGDWARSGTVDTALLERLRDEPYFALAPPKSTGRDLFNAAWLMTRIDSTNPVPSPTDVQATLCELTAGSIADGVHQVNMDGLAGRVVICGGGAHNRHLMERLAVLLAPLTVVTSASLGMAPDWVEATGFAWLARERLAGRAAIPAEVTGARHATVLGGVYCP